MPRAGRLSHGMSFFDRLLSSQSDRAYALLRIVGGAMFAFHGVQKIFGVLSPQGPPRVGSQLWLGGLIELLTGSLVALGLFTRYAAFLASGTMAVAYLQFHWKLQGGAQLLLPAINKGELALLYSFLLLFISTRGTVIWGLKR